MTDNTDVSSKATEQSESQDAKPTKTDPISTIDQILSHSEDIKTIADSIVTPICKTLEKNQEKKSAMHAETEKTQRDLSAERKQRSTDRVTIASQHNIHASRRLVWVLVATGLMIIACGLLVFYDRLSPETFALLIGTVIGYLIAFLSKNEQIVIAPREEATIGDEEY